MKKLIFLGVTAALLGAASCGNNNNTANDQKVKDSLERAAGRDVYVKAVTDAEAAIKGSKQFDGKLALAGIKAYSDFIALYPKDSLTPEYLLRAADLSRGTGNYQQAAIYLEQIMENHKGYPRYADACLMAALNYDDHLEHTKDGTERARIIYQYLIDKYPNTTYAENAKVLIQYLGKPDSLMINDIIQKGGK